ncbi:MAG: hypothetical protein HQ475_03355 [SAR202 cluster bacterium]|nr:hypothetical protein [SAR202 cluster bacterium]
MQYAEMKRIEKGLVFKTVGGVMVRTTGVTTYIPSHEKYAHEVEVIEGEGEGYRYLHNLDKAELMTGYAAAA